MPTLRYEEFAVDAALRPWLLNYWRFSVGAHGPDAAPHTVWPDGCTSIALLATPSPGPRIFWTGPRVTAMQPPLQPHSVMWGLRLWPDCSAAVLGLAAGQLRDRMGPADPSVVAWAAPLLDACDADDADDSAPVVAAFDALLRPRQPGWPQPDAAVRRALRFITARRGDVAMAEVAKESGLSLRQLQRRFAQLTGFTLRDWARIRRLRESIALRLQREGGWSAIAAETGFADHAHLTREFRALVGLAPSHVAERLDAIEHRNVRP